MKSPRLPEDILLRVKRFARLNGWSVVIVAGLGTLVAFALGDPIGISVGLLVTLGGALEVHGYRLLQRRDAGGMRWLTRSQLVVLATIWSYGLSRLLSFDAGYVQDQVIPDARTTLAARGIDLDSMLAEAGLDSANIVSWVRLFFLVLYGSVLLTALVYQGGLFLYYRWRTAAVEEALRPPPISPVATRPDPLSQSGSSSTPRRFPPE
jgi:hypothetical protein